MVLALLCVLSAAPEANTTKLPLRKLVLYENGVGYFERRGPVAQGRMAEIPLEVGQLDDALKSLVVMAGRGVASVEFAPPLAQEAARALAGMPGADEQRSLLAFLRALQGVDVQVTRLDGSTARGRVLEISDDEKLTDKQGHQLDDPTLMVFGEHGLSKTPVRLVQTVRPFEGAVSRAWSRAAATLAQQPEPERLVVRGASGSGEVAVGYTTEAAVWRTTYRLVMGAKPRLQGFALVHNDSDEAWSGVKVSLASGRPTSFLFPLAGPRYGRRDLVAPEDGLETAPQLTTREAHEHLRGSLSGSASGGGTAFGIGGIGTSGYGYGSGSSTSHSVGVLGVESTDLEGGPLPLEPAAVSEAGDLFLYTVREPVTLGARRSALLPIVDAVTKAERVTVVDASGTVFTGVRLENGTALTLEGGTMAVFADGAYAGETQIDRVKPGEVRVLKHGVDLDVEVTHSRQRATGETRRVSLNSGVLAVKRVDVLTHSVAVTSRADVAREMLIELPEAKFRVTSGAIEDVRSPGQPRFGRLSVPAHGETTLEVVEEGAVEERVSLEHATEAKLGEMLAKAAATLPAGERQLLERVKLEVGRVEAARARAAKLDEQLAQITTDIAELRESLAAMGKGGAVEAAKVVGQRLAALEAERSRLRVVQSEMKGAITARAQ